MVHRSNEMIELIIVLILSSVSPAIGLYYIMDIRKKSRKHIFSSRIPTVANMYIDRNNMLSYYKYFFYVALFGTFLIGFLEMVSAKDFIMGTSTVIISLSLCLFLYYYKTLDYPPFLGTYINGIYEPSISSRVIPWNLISNIGYFQEDNLFITRIEFNQPVGRLQRNIVYFSMNMKILQKFKSSIRKAKKELWIDEINKEKEEEFYFHYSYDERYEDRDTLVDPSFSVHESGIFVSNTTRKLIPWDDIDHMVYYINTYERPKLDRKYHYVVSINLRRTPILCNEYPFFIHMSENIFRQFQTVLKWLSKNHLLEERHN